MEKFIVKLAAVVGILVSQTAFSEDLVIVKDVNTAPRALDIIKSCKVGSKQFLLADDGIRGTELWLGTGFVGGTTLVKDIYPGAEGSIPGTNCIALGDKLIFSAEDGTTGAELWTSDGTASGTSLLKDIRSGAAGSFPSAFVEFNGKLLFSANDGTNGIELWITDGTSEGTILLKDIRSGNTSSNPSNITVLNSSTALFSANTNAEGTELWKTDGTSDGTNILKDINSGSSSSSPNELTLLGSKIFFAATTSATGLEPWISDGTSDGTTSLGDLFTGASSGYYNGFSRPAVLNGKVFFSARNNTSGYEAFVSDGTPGGTGLLKDIETGAGNSTPSYFTTVGSKVIFSANTTALGNELYSTDGTEAGTALLSDVNTGFESGLLSVPFQKLKNEAAALFLGNVVTDGFHRIHATEGTSVTLLTDLFPGASGIGIADISGATDAGISFASPELADSFPGAGRIFTDGTVSGTVFHPGTLSGFTESSAPIPMAELNGKLLFAASDSATGSELWSTDGTDSGTARITDINAGLGGSVLPLSGFGVLNNKLIFVASDGTNGAELWSSDGTATGTTLLKDIEPGAASSFISNGRAQKFYKAGNKLFFITTTSLYGKELWMTDGTGPGTTLVSDIRSGASSAFSDTLKAAVSTTGLGETLFFAANDGVNGEELWATTGAITGLTANIGPAASDSNPDFITPIPVSSGGFLGVAFRACPAATGCEIYLSFGGAPSVIDIVAGATGSNPQYITFPSPAMMIFYGSTAAAGAEIMKSDFPFTAASVVKDVIAGTGDFPIYPISVLNSTTVIFSGCAGAGGSDCELWKSDGTSAGTVQIKDIYVGNGSSFYGYTAPKALNGVAYFQAVSSDLISSVGYYRSDGTAEGTYKLTSQGFEYFSTDALPDPYTPALGTLFFPAASSAYGVELFKIGTDQCTSDDAKSIPGLCGCGVEDKDNDGDGAVDCLEACPTDPLKQAAGTCGCGVSDIDANGNSVEDCLDSQLPALTPDKPKIKFTKKNAVITMTERSGVTYELSYRVSKKPKTSKKAKYKKQVLTASSFSLKKPKAGMTLFAKYRYLISSSNLASQASKEAKKVRR